MLSIISQLLEIDKKITINLIFIPIRKVLFQYTDTIKIRKAPEQERNVHGKIEEDGVMALIQEISELLQKGRAKQVKVLVQQALDEGIDPKEILNDGLLAGMMIIGAKFKNNEVFVPEVLVAARAMNAGIAILEPKLIEVGNEPVGKAVIGTVKGDLHDIGKNLVTMMLKGAGFDICDIGVDVEADTFVEKAEEIGADVICMSALLTTTMPNMKNVIDVLEDKGLRNKYIVMVGGAPVNESFAKQIGADYYTPDAATCAEVAKTAVVERKAV